MAIRPRTTPWRAVLTAALVWTVQGVAAAQAPIPPLLPAREVIDRHIAAIGGADVVAAYSSRYSKGAFELRPQGMTGTMEVFSARPARQLSRIDMPGVGVTEAGYDGEVGWAIDPAVGPRLLKGRELERLRLLAEFDAALHRPERYATLETVARTTFDGKDCLKIRVVSKSGLQWIEYYDVATGLFAGMESEQETPTGPVTVTTTTGEYRRFDRLLLPTLTVQRVAGTGQEVWMTLTDVRFDAVDGAVFARPAAVRTLLAGK